MEGARVYFLTTMEQKKRLSILFIRFFFSLRKHEAENVKEFTKRFNKLYHKIPVTIQPTETAAMVAYSTTFEPDFTVSLRERQSVALLVMQEDAVAYREI